MSAPGSHAWLARHELRLSWRDWVSLLTAGRSRRLRGVVIAALIFLGVMHLLAFAIVAPLAAEGLAPDRETLVVISGALLLSLTTMISQSMDQVTRAFYARGDLDLILSSPVPASRVFAVRMTAIAVSTGGLTLAIGGPFVNALAVLDGAHWLAAYGVILAMGVIATAAAILLTMSLFRALGPKLTRAIAQVIAAIIGAAFVIGIQVAAILSIGSYARLSFLSAGPVMAWMPDTSSLVWWPARAAMGELGILLVIGAAGLIALALVIRLTASRFAANVIAAAGIGEGGAKAGRHRAGFQRLTSKQALRRKEWMALRRDPWLMSESLMQILYLVPPALLLWLNFRGSVGSLVILVPILVMAAGQLAGGLAWLAVSGEDAPELISSAPVSAGAIIAAKVEAVLAAIILVFAPFLTALALAAPRLALVAGLGIAASALSGVMVQIWFRAQAKRSRFRSRQTSSRVATLAEALGSISWAGTAALAAAGTWLAAGAAVFALITLACAWAMSPSRSFARYGPA